MLIERPPSLFRSLFPDAVFRLPSEKDKKRVFLTFDDGPIPEVTPWVLDVLDEYEAKATFFMVGENVKRYPAIYEEVVRRGHGVGNHTFRHLKSSGISLENYIEDTERGKAVIKSNLFRPPHGWLKRKHLNALKKNYKVIMYDLITRDYNRHLKATDVVAIVKRYVRDGSIIVFHDSLKSIPRLREALPASLEWMKNQGYEFCKIENELPEA